jgi:hypothetical protein
MVVSNTSRARRIAGALHRVRETAQRYQSVSIATSWR